MKNVAFYDILYLWLYYRLVDRKLSKKFSSWAQAKTSLLPFVIQFQAKYHASWCSTKSLWYCREVRKQSDKWNVMLQVLYHLPFKFFSCCGPLYISLNSISTCQSVTFEPWGVHQKLPRRKETHRCWIHVHFSRFSAGSTKGFWRCVIRSCQCRLHTDVKDIIVTNSGATHMEATQPVWKLPKLKQTRNAEPWKQWSCCPQIRNQAVTFTGQSVQE